MDSSAPKKPTIALVMLHRPHYVTGGIQAHVEQFQQSAHAQGLPTIKVTPYAAPAALLYPLFGFRRFLRGERNAWWFELANLTLLRVAMRKQWKREPFDIAYCQDPLSAKVALEMKARHRELRVVLAVHFNDSTAEEWVGRSQVVRGSALYQKMQTRDDRTIAHVDQLIFVSQYMRHCVLDRIPAANIVPYAVIFNSARPPDGRGADAPARDLISIGTLELRKNHEFLLHVLSAAKALGHIYTLTIIGTGPLRSQLQSLAAALGIADQVDLAGAVPNAGPLIREHRAYVHASTMENMPIALIEALAAGRPVFAAPVGGIPEVFEDGVQGRMWDLSDPASAARAVVEVLGTPDRYAAMCEAAAQRYREQFAPSLVADKLLSAVVGAGDF